MPGDKSSLISPENSESQDSIVKNRELEDLKNTFVALVSHELRTPLNLLAGYLDLTIQELEQDPKTAKKYLEIAEENTRKLTQVVQELTDFARLQRGKEIEYIDPMTVEKAFIQTYNLLKPNIMRKEINLIVDFPDTVRCMEYDGESLLILFRNLLSNAAKFSPLNGKVLVLGKIVNDYLSITVHDWASPIPENKRETIFEDFRQLENFLTRRYEGMGLGLAVARRTARFLGGNIQLTIREDGNTFEIILPVAASR
jgi:signal transduction histidine kinase